MTDEEKKRLPRVHYVGEPCKKCGMSIFDVDEDKDIRWCHACGAMYFGL
jgi:hypothetical protein